VQTSADAPDNASEKSTEPDQTPATEEHEASDAEEEEDEAPPVFCNQCGWENPSGAQYCSRCGESLQDLSGASPTGTRRVKADLPSSPASDEDDEEGTSSSSTEKSDREGDDEQITMGKQIAFVLGGALVVVLGLFFVTQWSNQYEWSDDASSPSQSAQAGAGGSGPSSARSSDGQRPMDGSGSEEQGSAPTDLQSLLDQTADSLGAIAGKIDSLQARIEQASGVEKREMKAKLVNLYIGAGHPDRAAVVQKELASATGRVDAQRRAADLLYRWMQKLERRGQRQQVFQVARHAAEAYETVSEQRPNDLDARTRMGESYLLTNEPMQGIKTINAVLDEDSTFVPARFQKGLALLQINRLEQARNQFEMVKQYAENDAPFYQQAERALKVIDKRQRSAPTGGE